jgi:ABC-type Fe3+ transport system substrate-binding protein
LRLAAVAAGGALLAACQTPAAAPTGTGPAPTAAKSAPTAGAANSNAEQQWAALVAAAQQEGRLSLHGPPTPETRQQVAAAFEKRFGIPVEYNALRTSELGSKMISEQQAGIVSIDAMLSGLGTFADVLYPAGLVADLKPVLILPEVTDPAHWYADPPLFMDPEGQKMMRLFNSATPLIAVNRNQVDPSRLKKAQNLLDPTYKGKIVSDDPLVPGPGSIPPAYFLDLFGVDFVKKLFGEQAFITRDSRQRADGLARGQYPIALVPGSADVQKLQADGFPVEVVVLEDAPGFTSGAFGVSVLVKGAPHPNAAKLFVNWIASKEGLEVYSRTQAEVGMRKDLDYTRWVPDFAIPKPGVNYTATYSWKFKTETQPAAQEKLKQILNS